VNISPAARAPLDRISLAGITGFVVGLLGGLIGLGGAEFRLPLLIGSFGFPALEAVIVNKATSLIVVSSGLVSRAQSIPFDDVLAQWPTIITLLAGSLAGAWFGADFATRLNTGTLYRIIAALLIVIAVVLLTTHDTDALSLVHEDVLRTVLGISAGFAIGVVASILGVAGGELLIPTLVLLFGLDIKLAGSVSLAISLPTMLVGFARYSRDQAFSVLRRNGSFVLAFWPQYSSCRRSKSGGIASGCRNPRHTANSSSIDSLEAELRAQCVRAEVLANRHANGRRRWNGAKGREVAGSGRIQPILSNARIIQ
jgi:uncharacterized protein